MAEADPTIEEWERLYNAAMNFKQEDCWNYMLEHDIFGIQNPETGEIGYCCVMGGNGEHFALAVYKGTEGLAVLVNLLNGEANATGIGALQMQNCLMASFEDRKLLNKKDHEIIKKLGLKFRGRNAWPLFRDYTPGFHPWYLNSKDIRFLTLALEQSVEMSRRMKENPETLTSEDDFIFLVRVPVNKKDEIIWKDEWLEPPDIVVEVKSVDMVEDPNYRTRFEKIMKGRKERKGTWEIGTFYLPEAVREGSERPCYPRAILYADHNSGMVLSFFMTERIDYQEDFINHFISFLEEIDFLPKGIVATDKMILAQLYPITYELEIELFEASYLDVIEDAQHGMFDFFR